jgi:hypothetical protein
MRNHSEAARETDGPEIMKRVAPIRVMGTLMNALHLLCMPGWFMKPEHFLALFSLSQYSCDHPGNAEYPNSGRVLSFPSILTAGVF